MKVEDIEAQWASDAKIDESRLGEVSSNIPVLHHKYYKILIRELMSLEKTQSESSILEKNKFMYYSGWMTDGECKALGWPAFEIKVPKTDIQKFINSDSDVIQLRIKIAVQNEKVNYLRSILKQINDRSFMIKNIIDFKRFENGLN